MMLYPTQQREKWMRIASNHHHPSASFDFHCSLLLEEAKPLQTNKINRIPQNQQSLFSKPHHYFLIFYYRQIIEGKRENQFGFLIIIVQIIMGKFNNDQRGDRGDRGGDRGRGGARGRGRGGPGGARGGRMGPKVFVQPHRMPGVFVARGAQDSLVTKNLVPGQSVYNEKRISVEVNGQKVEYRVWNPYRSKIAASVVGGISETGIIPGGKVLYLGGASGTTVSHVSDIVGPTGIVYAVEFSHRVGRDLVNMAKKRTNIIPIIHDARKPQDYRFLVGMVDIVFADVAQPDQARIISENVHLYLKNGGKFLISIKANCIDSTNEPEVVFANEVQKLKEYGLKPIEQLTLEPYERDHAMILGTYRA